MRSRSLTLALTLVMTIALGMQASANHVGKIYAWVLEPYGTTWQYTQQPGAHPAGTCFNSDVSKCADIASTAVDAQYVYFKSEAYDDSKSFTVEAKVVRVAVNCDRSTDDYYVKLDIYAGGRDLAHYVGTVWYVHLSPPEVTEGSWIPAGTRLGVEYDVNDCADGYHVHMEQSGGTWMNTGTQINPAAPASGSEVIAFVKSL